MKKQFRELNIKQRQYYDKIVVELIDGLATDGEHHKQHSLETVLRMICEDSWVNEAKDEIGWEGGLK